MNPCAHALIMPCLALVAFEAFAQSFPAKPVRVLVGFPAGGSIDIVTRILAQALTDSTGQNFIVDNRAGAGGNLAVEALVRADADGYTILNGATGLAVNPSLYRKVNYTLDDLAPIAVVGEAPVLFMAHPSVPANSIPELIKLAKAKPGAVRAAILNGTTAHLASDMFRMMTGIDMPLVPYKGGGQAFQDVIGGQVEVVVLPMSESLAYVRAKRVKALGQTGATRSSLAPDIPTLDEAGVKGYAVTAWYMICGPARMPRELVTRLSAEISKVLKQPETVTKMKNVGVEIIAGTPEQAAKFLRAEADKWAKLIQWSGARAD